MWFRSITSLRLAALFQSQQCHADDDPHPRLVEYKDKSRMSRHLVTAFRDSGLVNPSKIGMVGGSAGASLAAYVALDTTDTSGNWPYWSASVRPACVVSLSAFF